MAPAESRPLSIGPPPDALTRRDLLKSAAAMAAAGLAPVVPGGVAAARIPAAQAGSKAVLLDRWEHYRGTLGGVWEVWRGDKASDNVPWQTVAVPHCVNAIDALDPDTRYYQGPAWYRTTITPAPPPAGWRTLLCFEGAGQAATVWIQTRIAGTHVGGYDEWALDVTDLVSRIPGDLKGAVPIAVLCDNSRDLERLPSALSDFNLYGGLYRKVWLSQVPPVSIERVLVTPTLAAGGSGSVEVRLRLHDPATAGGTATVTVRMLDPAGREFHAREQTLPVWSGNALVATAPVPAPVRWSPAAPRLYRCEVTVRTASGESAVAERFGFRQVEWVERGPFRLNGERLLIRGTQRHEDHAGVGAAMTDDLIRREMQAIRDMGANFVRLGHYQQSRLVLDQCDELGLMVWEEIPWCRGGLGGDRYKAQARDMLRAMIDQHANHPSVILWGLGNENDWPGDFEEFDEGKIAAFMRELNDLAHRLDPTRQTAIRRCEFCKDIPDVYSPSIWAGWYRGRYTEYRDSTEQEMKKVRRFFHAEWGGDSHSGRHSEDPDRLLSKVATGGGADERGLDYLLTGGQSRASRDGDWSETYICNLFDWHLKEQDTMPWLTGAAQWVFKDFSTPLRGENPIPRMNQKGVVARDLTPKEGYYVFQSYWSAKPMVRVYGHTWPIRWGEPGERKLIKVYSNCASVELFVNGASLCARNRNSRDYPAAGLRWTAPLREGENVVRAVGAAPGGAIVSDEIRFGYTTRTWGPAARLVLRAGERQGDTVTVDAEVVDGDGLRCLDSRLLVRFAAAGAGRLHENLGVMGGSRVVELANGRCHIRLDLQGGTSVVSLSAKGLATAFLTID
jgi:beta-galactosidase